MNYSNLITFHERIKEIIVKIGYFNTWLVILDQVFVKLFKGRLRIYKYYFTAQPVIDQALLAPHKGRKIVVRQINRDDPIIQVFPRPERVIKNRFDSGAICLVAFNESNFVGYLWLILGAYQEDEIRAKFIPLPSTITAWDFDVYVHPTYRLGYAFLRLWDEANRFMLDRKIEWSCSRISAINASSINVHKKLGTLTMGQAIFLCMGNWQITLATVFPYIHLSTHLNSYPEFILDTQKIKTIFPKKRKDSTTE